MPYNPHPVEEPIQHLRYPLATVYAVSNRWNFIRVLCSNNFLGVTIIGFTNLTYPGLAFSRDLRSKLQSDWR